MFSTQKMVVRIVCVQRTENVVRMNCLTVIFDRESKGTTDNIYIKKEKKARKNITLVILRQIIYKNVL